MDTCIPAGFADEIKAPSYWNIQIDRWSCALITKLTVVLLAHLERLVEYEFKPPKCAIFSSNFPNSQDTNHEKLDLIRLHV